MKNKSQKYNQKIDITTLRLFKNPSAQGLEKDAYFFALEQDDKMVFLRTGRAYSAKKMYDKIWGEEFVCQFSEDSAESKFSFHEGKSKIYYAQDLTLVLGCHHFSGDLSPQAITYLRREMKSRTYSLKKLLEIEDEFVLMQIENLKRQIKKSREDFNFSALEM